MQNSTVEQDLNSQDFFPVKAWEIANEHTHIKSEARAFYLLPVYYYLFIVSGNL